MGTRLYALTCQVMVDGSSGESSVAYGPGISRPDAEMRFEPRRLKMQQATRAQYAEPLRQGVVIKVSDVSRVSVPGHDISLRGKTRKPRTTQIHTLS